MGKLDMVVQKNILAKYFKPLINSRDFALYSDQLYMITGDLGLANPNINEYERRVEGQSGIYYRERTYNDQPWSMATEYNEAIDRLDAIFSNQPPSQVEDESSGNTLVARGGEVGIDAKNDIFHNQLDRTNTNFVKSLVYFNSRNNQVEITIPHENSSGKSLSGVAARGYAVNKPFFFEGWGVSDKVQGTGETVPDAKTNWTEGGCWLRRDDDTKLPYKAFQLGGQITHTTPAADPRYDAVIAYESNGDGTDYAIMVVEGTEAATPVKVLDSAIETAVDLVISGARWCRLGDVYVEVLPTIEDSDITRPELAVATFHKTPIAIPVALKEDAFFIFDYVAYMKQTGEWKDNTRNITESSTAITFTVAITNMFEVGYWVEPQARWNEING